MINSNHSVLNNEWLHSFELGIVPLNYSSHLVLFNKFRFFKVGVDFIIKSCIRFSYLFCGYTVTVIFHIDFFCGFAITKIGYYVFLL